MLAAMVKEFKLNNKQTSSAPSKTCYSKPTLERLGYVREMTLAGSGQNNESAGANIMCSADGYNINLMCQE